MTTSKVKRSSFKTFINTTPSSQTPTWSLLGDGVSSAEIQYNPQTMEETFIHNDSGTTVIESYRPAMPIEAVCVNGEAVFEFVDGLRKARAVLDAAVTDVVNVWLYETATQGAYPAEKQSVSIAINSFGGVGGETNKISFTLNYAGDPTSGTFNPTSSTFTAA